MIEHISNFVETVGTELVSKEDIAPVVFGSVFGLAVMVIPEAITLRRLKQHDRGERLLTPVYAEFLRERYSNYYTNETPPEEREKRMFEGYMKYLNIKHER